jgi:apolipoprotein N-acyltransferase
MEQGPVGRARASGEPRAERTGWGRLLPAAAALATAGLVILSSPGLTRWWPLSLLGWLAPVPLLLELPHHGLRRAFVLGWGTGTLINLGLCSCFPALLTRFAGVHPTLAIALTLLIVAYQGLAWAAWATLVRAAAATRAGPLLAATAMVLVERWFPMVFPYSLGLTQYRCLPVIQVAELGGPYVVTFLMFLMAATVAGAIGSRREGQGLPWRAILVASGAVAATLAFGQVRLASTAKARERAPTVHVGVVQGGVAQTDWVARPTDDLATLTHYQQISSALERQDRPEWLVWPEKAYPLLLRHDATHDYPLGNPHRVRAGFEQPLIFGATTVDVSSRELYNSAAFLDASGGLQIVYDKVRLILYSEWLPSSLSGWVSGKRYRSGTRLEPLLVPVSNADGTTRPVPVSIFICFEAIFPDHVRELMKRRPELLINLSDDSWFGDSMEPEQHLSSTVFRAIESRRDLVRATGSGISALIAATGEIEQRAELSKAPSESRSLDLRQVRLLRVPSIYGAMGDLFCWCSAAIVLLVVGARRARRARRSRGSPP